MPRIERTAEAVWEGRVASGSGTIAGRSSSAFELTYSEPTRVGDPAGQTSPEELVAAAHAGCFAMSLAAEISKLHPPPPASKSWRRVRRTSREEERWRLSGARRFPGAGTS